MTRIIEFEHTGHLVRAVAIFNFAGDGCSVLVLPITRKDEFSDIELTKTGQEWSTNSKIKSVFALTYFKLLNVIDSVITQRRAFSRVQAQNLLL
jgi:hypothetical protein